MMYNLVVMETFGEWLRTSRKNKGWTQDQLRQKSNVSSSYISTLERSQPHSVTGASLRPEPKIVTALAQALGENVDEALRLAGYAPNESREIDEKSQLSIYSIYKKLRAPEIVDRAKYLFQVLENEMRRLENDDKNYEEAPVDETNTVAMTEAEVYRETDLRLARK